MTSAWPCIEEWRQRTESGSSDIPNLSALRNFAHHLVQVADCSTRRYNEFDREERHLGQILDLWEKEGESGSTLYVKDWHQALLLEEDGGKQDQVYTTPDVFQGQYHCGSLSVRDLRQKPITDDWMTHHALTLDPPDDYRFTYAGPKGTYTPLHRDVYGSYSWSSNIVGRKRWWLIPPEHTDIVWTQPGGSEVVFDLRELDETLWRERVLEVVQEAGETIFVPSGWYHQVENLDFVSRPPYYHLEATLDETATVYLYQPEFCVFAHHADNIPQSTGVPSQSRGGHLGCQGAIARPRD